MGNRQKEFLDTISKDLSPAELQLFYQQHNIIFERADVFRDLSISLARIIHSTYLGDDVTPPSQQLQHFKWCWGKTLDSFAKEKILFNKKGSLYEYFATYFREMYYSKDNKKEELAVIIRYWKFILSYTNTKRHQDISLFMVTYNLMSENLIIQ